MPDSPKPNTKAYRYEGVSVGAFLVGDAMSVDRQLADAGYETFPLPRLHREYPLCVAATALGSVVSPRQLSRRALLWVGGGEWTRADWAGPYRNAFAAVYARKKGTQSAAPVLYTVSYINSTREAVETNRRIWSLPAELGSVEYHTGGDSPSMHATTEDGTVAMSIRWDCSSLAARIRLPAVPMSQRLRYATAAGVESDLTMDVRISIGTVVPRLDSVHWDARSRAGRFLAEIDAKPIIMQNISRAEGDVFEPNASMWKPSASVERVASSADNHPSAKREDS